MSDQLLALIAFELGVALVGALAGGLLAQRLGQPLYLGYLGAGVALSPYTPGHSSNPELLAAAANVAVFLLLFILAVQFPIDQLVRRPIAGLLALVQVSGITVAVTLVAVSLGLNGQAGLIVGLAVATSSIALTARLLDGRVAPETRQLALAWSMVQGGAALAVVATGPALLAAPGAAPGLLLLPATVLPIAFVAARVLLRVALARLASDSAHEIAQLLVAGVVLVAVVLPTLFVGLPLAFAALAGGLLVGGISGARDRVRRLVRLREVFVALFLVSLGTLFNPGALLDELATVAVLLAAALTLKWVTSTALARAGGIQRGQAMLVGAALANCGEFSFLVAQEGLGRGLVEADTHQLLMGTTAASIGASSITMPRVGGTPSVRS